MDKAVNDNIFSGFVKVAPAEHGLKGEIIVPGDKSISHRAVIFGSIAEGKTEIDGFLEGEDNFSTINAFKAMGVEITAAGPNKITVKGSGLRGLKEPDDVIDAGNSGTTARLLAGLLSAQDFYTVMTGDPTLRRRPMKRVVEPLKLMGASIEGRKGASLLPISIAGRELKGINYNTPVASAQLKSAILLAGIYAKGETIVNEPEKSRDHTERMLKLFGGDMAENGNSVMVRSTKSLTGCKITVPGDISSSAFFMVGGAISPGSELLIRNTGINPTRTGIIKILQAMGAGLGIANERQSSGEPVADIVAKSASLKGIDIDGPMLLPAIDEFPIICVAAAFAEGATRIRGAAELRVKESDRISSMAESLSAIGINVKEHSDGIDIEGIGKGFANGGRINSRGDHRIAMAMAMAALRTQKGIEIEGAASVDVSFPGFFDMLEGVRA